MFNSSQYYIIVLSCVVNLSSDNANGAVAISDTVLITKTHNSRTKEFLIHSLKHQDITMN